MSKKPVIVDLKIFKMFQYCPKVYITLGVLLVSIAVYTLPYRMPDPPISPTVDVIGDQSESHSLVIDPVVFWGLVDHYSILSADEKNVLHDTIDRMKDRHYIRRVKRQRMEQYLVKYYHLTEEQSRTLVRSVERNARRNQLEFELLLAVIFVESSFNPNAESGYGAIGLMQVVPKWHLDKINQYGDESILYDIPTNITIGTDILVGYLQREGDIRTALHRYNGSQKDTTYKYSNRVFDKYQRLKKMMYVENMKLDHHWDIVSNLD